MGQKAMSWFQRKPLIEFTCDPKLRLILAKPAPAKEFIPEWFAKLKPQDTHPTAKRCLPFVQAMTEGWIIPLAVDVKLTVSGGGKNVKFDWDNKRLGMIGPHDMRQIGGHPSNPRHIGKIINHWGVKTRTGWSCLFLPPLNRPSPIIETFAGIVDTDVYMDVVNVPFVVNKDVDGEHIFPAGMPLVQVIPFKRAGRAGQEVLIRTETPGEKIARERSEFNCQRYDNWYTDLVKVNRRG
jgi:hypothetical protein